MITTEEVKQANKKHPGRQLVAYKEGSDAPMDLPGRGIVKIEQNPSLLELYTRGS